MKLDIKAALQLLDSGQYVSIAFFTADILKKKGGEYIEIQKCRVIKKGRKLHNTFEDINNGNENDDVVKKAQNHHIHFTRNLQLQNNDFRKVHVILITHINKIEII